MIVRTEEVSDSGDGWLTCKLQVETKKQQIQEQSEDDIQVSFQVDISGCGF